ncbi:hypothetical protein [Actinomadura darangshiensis]|uniref:hypothetical protein n=1 Tax=Actinomadura darangshiensis TaxID=705336 RepID=UPI001FB5E7F9|nr:hypothetical protein [Actinomadura darangshiensis]
MPDGVGGDLADQQIHVAQVEPVSDPGDRPPHPGPNLPDVQNIVRAHPLGVHLVPDDHRVTPAIISAATRTDPAGVRWAASHRNDHPPRSWTTSTAIDRRRETIGTDNTGSARPCMYNTEPRPSPRRLTISLTSNSSR